jgi:c-di-GMP-binding flagellar brake protein YcgR
LFSRKKTNPLIISIDEERRVSFRVKPSSKEPIDVSIGRSRYHVKDISAGGIGIYKGNKDKELEIGKEYPCKMTLPLINEVISGIIRIIDISDRVYHCIFIGFSNEQRDKIHLFVLERQKEELREKGKT